LNIYSLLKLKQIAHKSARGKYSNKKLISVIGIHVAIKPPPLGAASIRENRLRPEPFYPSDRNRFSGFKIDYGADPLHNPRTVSASHSVENLRSCPIYTDFGIHANNAFPGAGHA
jgi:hypothetical protein